MISVAFDPFHLSAFELLSVGAILVAALLAFAIVPEIRRPHRQEHPRLAHTSNERLRALAAAIGHERLSDYVLFEETWSKVDEEITAASRNPRDPHG